MIESLIPKREETPVTPQPATPVTQPSETEQLKTQLQELKDQIAKLSTQPLPKEETPPTPPATPPTPPTFPTAPTTGASGTTDHRARFLEIYNRNPYLAATYLEKHPNEIAATTKELIS